MKRQIITEEDYAANNLSRFNEGKGPKKKASERFNSSHALESKDGYLDMEAAYEVALKRKAELEVLVIGSQYTIAKIKIALGKLQLEIGAFEYKLFYLHFFDNYSLEKLVSHMGLKDTNDLPERLEKSGEIFLELMDAN